MHLLISSEARNMHICKSTSAPLLRERIFPECSGKRGPAQLTLKGRLQNIRKSLQNPWVPDENALLM